MRALRRAGVVLASFAAIAVSGGCESIYGIGDLPHGSSPAGTDAGPCTPLTMATAPTNGAAACAGDGVCTPGNVSAYAPPWIPPVDRTGACTSVQLTDYFAKCIDTTTGTVGLCDAWKLDPRNSGCFGCVLVQPNAPKFGAAVAITGTTNFQINRPGCIALAEPCNLPCAQAALAQILCAYTACDPTKNCANAGDNALTTCLTTATTTPTGTPCACQGFAAAATCIDNISGAALTKCGGTGIELYRNVAAFMCGPL